ncbi:MAG TPA: DUF4097 family beta strand repeat-containing protein [Candidatus Binatia bacterium]|nr:DUF4097 family beta strand repeat-containing protein [Candidatus Binatia bacterium]
MSSPKRLITGRIVALTVGVTIALCMIAWGTLNVVALGVSDKISVDRTLPASENAVSATIVAGDLSFMPSGDDQVHVSGAVDYHLLQPTVTITRSGAGVSIDVSCPWSWLVVDACSAHLTVKVPPQLAVTASTVSGNITATGLHDISLSTVSGNITAIGLHGVSLQSTSGGQTVSDIGGTATLNTISGTIRGRTLGASRVKASDVSGAVSLGFSTAPSNVWVNVTSGSVLVTVPAPSLPYLVTAHSTTGATTIGVPTDPSSTHLIAVTTVSGDISVQPAG